MSKINRLRVCAESGCPELTTETRCKNHRRAFERAREENLHRELQPWRKVYSDPRWVQLRKRVKVEQPICAVAGCSQRTQDVDHIIPTQDGGPAFDRANLQGLCHKHHSEKTAREVNARK